MDVETVSGELHDGTDDTYRWRLERFMAIGFEHVDADLLAAAQADWHRAEAMLGHGCPALTVVRILT